MAHFIIQISRAIDSGDVLNICFGEPGTNAQIVREVHRRLEDMKSNGELKGGPLLRVHGPASLPVCYVIAHAVAHLYMFVAVYDPKLMKYIVTISHGSELHPGDLIE